MDKHYIKNPDGSDQKDEDGNRMFWSGGDGDWDPDHHQTVYHETPSGNKEDKHVHYNPSKGDFHKK